ncbi:MAG: prephenate dehydrogenase/arogenate dehydrogenase family protein [Bdellovibrionota bacterium]|nr:prephenate dehydrogenase/arogenate dehydrogenase family protein [Bdellovibrionota bacterium]
MADSEKSNKLLQLRDGIDEIDDQIKKLLLERFELVSEVQLYKANHKVPIIDKDREDQKRHALRKGLEDSTANQIQNIFNEIMKQSKRRQLSPGKSSLVGEIGIVGMGLMGGSLYKAIKEHHPLVNLKAWDQNENDSWLRSDLSEVLQCRYIFLALPVTAIKDFLSANKKKISAKSTVIDFGSTKKMLSEHSDNISDKEWKFIPAHPLVGKESSGFENAEASLYHGKTLVICNHESFLEDDFLTELLGGVGLRFYFMNSQDHDDALAYISHLPHLVALALIQTVKDLPLEKNAIPQSFKDLTRIGGANGSLWADIFESNKESLLKANEQFINNLQVMAADLENIEKLFTDAIQFRKEYCDDYSYEVVPQQK